MGDKRVIQAIKDQADAMACEYRVYRVISMADPERDIYNAQCSNAHAEELAHIIVERSGGAFELCGFVSGGGSCTLRTTNDASDELV